MSTLYAPESIRAVHGEHASVRRALLLFLFLILLGSFDQLVAATTATLPVFARVRVLEPAGPINDAELVDQDGRPFRLTQLRGRVALVFFGFTNCPDVCPLAMQRLRQLEETVGPELADVAYVMISIDGERDTPDALKTFLEHFSPRFIGLTGDPGIVKAIAMEFSAAFFKGGATEGGSNYTISHSPQIFVLDSAGRLRAEFYGASTEAMSGVTLALLREAQKLSNPETLSESEQ